MRTGGSRQRSYSHICIFQDHQIDHLCAPARCDLPVLLSVSFIVMSLGRASRPCFCGFAACCAGHLRARLPSAAIKSGCLCWLTAPWLWGCSQCVQCSLTPCSRRLNVPAIMLRPQLNRHVQVILLTKFAAHDGHCVLSVARASTSAAAPRVRD